MHRRELAPPRPHLHEAGGFCSQGFDVFHATGLTEGRTSREDSEADMVSGPGQRGGVPGR